MVLSVGVSTNTLLKRDAIWEGKWFCLSTNAVVKKDAMRR